MHRESAKYDAKYVEANDKCKNVWNSGFVIRYFGSKFLDLARIINRLHKFNTAVLNH